MNLQTELNFTEQDTNLPAASHILGIHASTEAVIFALGNSHRPTTSPASAKAPNPIKTPPHKAEEGSHEKFKRY